MHFLTSAIAHLLSNAKLPENIPQQLLGGDFAGDGAQVVQGLADINGNQVGWCVVGKSFFNAFNALGGACERFIMTQAVNNGLVVGFAAVGRSQQTFGDQVDVFVALCRYKKGIEFNQLFK